MKEQWKKLASRFDALGRRERVLGAVAALVGLIFLFYMFSLDSHVVAKRRLAQQLAEARQGVALLQEQLKAQQARTDPDAARKAQRDALRKQLAEVDRSMTQVQRGLVPPERTAKLLDGIGVTSTWTPPAGMTETVDVQGGTQALEVSYAPQAAAVSISKTATSSATGTGNAHILALRRVAGALNAFDTTTPSGAISGFIKTKVAGTSVTLATIALNPPKNAVATTFLGTVRVEVLDASDNSAAMDSNGCRPTWTVIQTLSPDITFAVADLGRKNISFSLPNSYRDVRLRMSTPAGAPEAIGCSSDNFAMRPDQFINVSFKDTDWENADPSGTGRTLDNMSLGVNVAHKAGQPFTVRATAVNGAGTPATTTNYTGTITRTDLGDCGATPACVDTPSGTLTVGGTFSAGQLTSNVATYSDVGSFTATLVDSTFANVDAADGSTTAEREIKSSAVNVGRFVPDHFAVSYNTPSFTTACGPGGFTYVGQPFNYSIAPVITVTAQNASNATTTNYTGSLWRISNLTLTGKSYSAASGTVDASGITGSDPVVLDTGNGTGTLTFVSGTGLLFTRGAAVAPFDADISLAINVIDVDGVTYTANPARFGQASAGNGIGFDSGKQMRFGRLALRNANGSQLVPLTVRMEAQYAVAAGAGIAFVTNKDDSCTSLANNNIQMSGFTSNLSACETAITGAGALSGGRKLLILPPPGNANNGSMLLTANLGASASGTTCTSVGGGTVSAAGANKTYLQGAWSGSAYDDDPSARATFGKKGGAEEVIFVRENF